MRLLSLPNAPNPLESRPVPTCHRFPREMFRPLSLRKRWYRSSHRCCRAFPENPCCTKQVPPRNRPACPPLHISKTYLMSSFVYVLRLELYVYPKVIHPHLRIELPAPTGRLRVEMPHAAPGEQVVAIGEHAHVAYPHFGEERSAEAV